MLHLAKLHPTGVQTTGSVILSLLFLIGFAGIAASGPKEDWSACRNLSGIDAILGCTPILLHKHGDDKKLSRAFYLRGLNYLNLRDLKRAEIDFLDSIRLNPGNTIAYEQLNFIYTKWGNQSAAVQIRQRLRDLREKAGK